MKKTVLLLILFTISLLTFAQQPGELDLDAEKSEVKEIVERFLKAAGNYDVDSMPILFSEKANIGGASFKNGEWNSFTMSIAEFLKLLRSQSNPKKYTEPVTKYTIYMDGGMLAFVKADAVLIRNGNAQSNNFDYFTLIKEEGHWKILNGSYVSIPIVEQ